MGVYSAPLVLAQLRPRVISLRLGRVVAKEGWEEMVAKPLIVIDPQPRSREEIFEPKIWARLKDLGELAIHEGPGRMPAERFESYLPETALLVGQSGMPKSRLDRASKLARHHQCRDQLPPERRLLTSASSAVS